MSQRVVTRDGARILVRGVKNLEFEIVKTPRDRRKKKNSDVFGVLVV